MLYGDPRTLLPRLDRRFLVPALAAALASAFALSASGQLVPAGGPWRLDAVGPRPSPWNPMVLLAPPEGGFLALWQVAAEEDARVLGRRFGEAGPVGDVVDFGAGPLADAAVASDGTVLLAGGGWIRRRGLDGREVGTAWAYDDSRVEPGTERCSSCIGGGFSSAALAVDPSGEILVAWPILLHFTDPEVPLYQLGQLLVRRFDGLGRPLGGSWPMAQGYAFWDPDVSAAGDGAFLVTATRTYDESYDFDDGLRVLVDAADGPHELAGAEPVWAMRSAVAPAGRSLTVYVQTGWEYESDDGDCTGAFGLLADAAGDLGDGPIDLPRDRTDCQSQVRVAAGPDGFVAGWQTDRWSWLRSGPGTNPFHGISLRRFDLDGRPLGDPLDLRLGAATFGPAPDDASLGDVAVASGRVAVLAVGRGGVWAALAAPVPAGPCRLGPDHLCLGGAAGDRFRVDVAFLNPYAGQAPGRGLAHPLTADSGAFWFFAPDNLELVVKVLDGRGVNGRFWVFAGAATTVEWWATVTDTTSREQWGRSAPPHRLATLADIAALPRPPSVIDPGPPRPPGMGLDGTSQEVELGGRYHLEVRWRDPRSGADGFGRGRAVTGDTALFWFFDPANVELLVKFLDGRPVNGYTWVFWGSLTHVVFELHVHDTATGAVRWYRNEAPFLGGGADTRAFP